MIGAQIDRLTDQLRGGQHIDKNSIARRGILSLKRQSSRQMGASESKTDGIDVDVDVADAPAVDKTPTPTGSGYYRG